MGCRGAEVSPWLPFWFISCKPNSSPAAGGSCLHVDARLEMVFAFQ